MRKKSLRQILFILMAAGFMTLGCFDGEAMRTGAAAPVNYKREMSRLIAELYDYGKSKNPAFGLIGNNAGELFTESADYDKADVDTLAGKLGGILLESFFYGADMTMNKPSAESDKRDMRKMLYNVKKKGVPVFNIDYCNTSRTMIDSAASNKREGFVGFTAVDRGLKQIPLFPINLTGESSGDITSLQQVKNFLCLLDPSAYRSKGAYLSALRNTNFDLLIIDLFYEDYELSSAEVESLKKKQNGGKRLVYAYMSIGEAEDYRSYWQADWSNDRPEWLDRENPDWEGNYKVKYWHPDWKAILFGNAHNSSLDHILFIGFDGAFLDVIDSWVYFTELGVKG